MSTILKALRRLEEDGSGKAKPSEEELAAEAAAIEAAPPPSEEEKRAYRQALSAPRASDELRERILSEELASEAVRPESAQSAPSRPPIADRGGSMASDSDTQIGPPLADPFANRVVEPAFTPPSNSVPSEVASAPSSSPSSSSSAEGISALAGGQGVFPRGMLLGVLGGGLALALVAGFLIGGNTSPPPNDAENASADSLVFTERDLAAKAEPIATSVLAPLPEPVAVSDSTPPSTAPALVPSSSPSPSPSLAPAARQELAAAPAVAEMQETPPAPMRPMTVARNDAAATATEMRAQAELAQSALARAAVRPTRAAEQIESSPKVQPVAEDSVVAARPRPQRLPGERARVSAPGPKSAAEPSPKAASPKAAPVQVAEAAQIKELPLAEVIPSSARSTAFQAPPPRSTGVEESAAIPIREPEASRPRAGSVRPSAAPAPQMTGAAPTVDLAQRRALPDLTVIRTSWHPASDRRSAKIRLEAQNELVTLREGDAVGGMVIHEISPSAVVFSAGEVQIRRRVGEAGR